TEEIVDKSHNPYVAIVCGAFCFAHVAESVPPKYATSNAFSVKARPDETDTVDDLKKLI
ncbi:hypothetical protein BGZ73_008843, partial [Actinomortierella ambigua]